MPPWQRGAVAVVVCVLTAATAYAHGVVGDYVFLEPLIAEDPTPANELDIVQPTWTKSADGRTYSIGTSIEKVLGTDADGLPRFSLAAGTAWEYQSPDDGPDRKSTRL